jgi:hypothetical protein
MKQKQFKKVEVAIQFGQFGWSTASDFGNSMLSQFRFQICELFQKFLATFFS